MIRGYFRSRGIRLQRDRIRKSLARIDPRNARIRRAITMSRRAYCVPGRNSLWHLHGHHSLVSWGFVIHEAIDGYSRLNTYLHCSSNNRSEAVKELFLDAIQSFGMPSRVPTDQGGENVFFCLARNGTKKRPKQGKLFGRHIDPQPENRTALA